NLLNFLKKYQQAIFLIVILALAAILLSTSNPNSKKKTAPVADNTEIQQIKTTNNLQEQVGYYKKLIERVGPIQAQEDLYHSGLPFTGQTHLLNHTVGDYLYEKFGAAGLSQCKEYFLSSCYHGFILNAIGTGGLPEVAKVME